MKKVYILPTGDEIQSGIVLDLDAPELMGQILRRFPKAEVTRLCPLLDVEDTIFRKIEEVAAQKPDLIILIGGSGGGHRFSPTLGKDFTHTALARYLDEYASHEIYGKNGHMWTKLVCGKKKRTPSSSMCLAPLWKPRQPLLLFWKGWKQAKVWMRSA